MRDMLAIQIGSGKSSLLQGVSKSLPLLPFHGSDFAISSQLIGEMNQLSGKVSFSGNLGYCQQNAWIQNLTVRENILFGKPYEEDRYWRAVKAAALPSDLELFADGDMTEIGERGVNLSGGQKSRLNIARALYSNADIVLLDDPLSAVDAHVGLHLFEQAILGLKEKGKTVVLVTHALHMLAKRVDYIYSLEAGKIVEEGTYGDLIRLDGPFKRLVREYGGQHEEEIEREDVEDQKAMEEVTRPIEQKITKKMMGSAAGVGKLEGRLMKGEVRKTGSVRRNLLLLLGTSTAQLTDLALDWVLSAVVIGWFQGLHAVPPSRRSRDHGAFDLGSSDSDARLQYPFHALDHILAKRRIQPKPQLLHGHLCCIGHWPGFLHLCPWRDHRCSFIFRISFAV